MGQQSNKVQKRRRRLNYNKRKKVATKTSAAAAKPASKKATPAAYPPRGPPAMSARYLVIDGHSVIFAWADLRKLHDQNRAAARKALLDRLQHLHDTTDWRVTVVLDGKLGTSVPNGARKPTDMVVSYATADQ